MTTEELNLNHEAVHKIITEDLNMGKVCAQIVPKHLSDDKKAH
jgi:hypothetical protein